MMVMINTDIYLKLYKLKKPIHSCGLTDRSSGDVFIFYVR